MALPASEEPADPRRRLFRLAYVGEVRLEDASEAGLVLPLAYERLELVTERAKLLLRLAVADLGDAVVS